MTDVFSLPGVAQLPMKTRVGGFVYAVEFDNATVKVGMTNAPRKRIELHVRTASAFGVSALRCWMSPLHDNYQANERTLIDLAASLSNGARNIEYFIECQFDRLVAKARKMHFEPVSTESDEVNYSHGQWIKDAMDAACAAELERSAKDFWSHVGLMFGRVGDRYDVPSFPGTPVPYEVVRQIAELTGEDVDDILSMSMIDMIRETIITIVRAEAAKLHIYALENGRSDLLGAIDCPDIPCNDEAEAQP